MTLADDLVEAQQPFVAQSPDLEVWLRGLAAAFAQIESYVSDPDDTDSDIFVNRANWCPNPNFEYDTLGAAAAGWLVTVVSGSLTNSRVENGWAATGGRALHLTSSGSTALTAVCSQQPAWPGQPWSCAATLNVLTNVSPGIVIEFFDSVGTLLGRTVQYGSTGIGVQTIELADVLAPANTAFVGAGVTAVNVGGGYGVVADGGDSVGRAYGSSLNGGSAGTSFGGVVADGGVAAGPGTATIDLYLDSVMLQDGGPVDATFWDGDIPGYQWTGVAGNSPSAPVLPIPDAGWSKMWDVDKADTAGLPYLAQIVGERLQGGISDANARHQIKTNPNSERGQIRAIAYGIMPYLTGSQSVFTAARRNIAGTTSINSIAVLTYGFETLSSALVRLAFRRLAPWWIAVDYATITAETWAAIESGSPTWATIESGSPTWQTIESVRPGFVPAGFTLWTPS